jgi:cardiolipin synthase A/B
MNWGSIASEAWQYTILAISVAAALAAGMHALLYKRDARSAVLWLGLIALLPLFGAFLYIIFGVNRIKRRALLLRGDLVHYEAPSWVGPVAPEALAAGLAEEDRHLAALLGTTGRVVRRPLLPGNRIVPLTDGDEAYPEMLAAIAGAKRSISLLTYIFDRDATGLEFARALGAAVRRGVEVRVLVDATGIRYSLPSIRWALRREAVPHARFRPTFPLWQILSLNLRNHRKLMVVDGSVGFAGGINLREGHWLARGPKSPVRDLHFRIEGPAVAHLQEVFVDDWVFTTGESLRGERWFPPLAACGTVVARGIADGPDEDFEKLRWTILAALAAAKRSVRIATPYFLPEATLVAALNLAAMRGVAVEILLPGRGNLPFVHWASRAHWWQVLERGCRIRLSGQPFDHSKLFVVDERWALIGSTNWDPRSLRLNFEFNLECYDRAFSETLSRWFDERYAVSRPVTLDEVDARPLPTRLLDGVARLFTPFL